MTSETDLTRALAARYSDAPTASADAATLIQSMAVRGSCRNFAARPVPDAVLDMLCAVALASPTKSDLQQRDIVVLKSLELRAQLAQLVAGQAWVADAPMLLVFCGNNRRQRMLHTWRRVPFANDHLDAVINATADAAIALGAFVTAAEALGLGCCPISAVRNDAEAVSDLLGLPDHVFPFAGLALGYPATPPPISKRLPMHVTCHVDRYQEDGLREAVAAYDKDRAATQPYGKQRFVEQFGQSDTYGWSEDKTRQYSAPERAGFGAYIRKRGFCLD
ncbi:nitroreductase family protein [Tateyamaria omphalii]|uniref:nitroreductase family protein n=1 Tax=Tateyamaria omphalii TaxID=299262 RepID=UPI001C994CAB|nr:nitroreductase family protein [Tateyamaria omphalii]MBY5933551.1 nitroreductase family protein [Tateyamaria omphalii]